MVNVLRRDITAGFKGAHKSNSHVHQMFLNLICYSFIDKENWPEVFVKVGVYFVLWLHLCVTIEKTLIVLVVSEDKDNGF